MERRIKQMVGIAIMLMIFPACWGCNKKTVTVFEKPTAGVEVLVVPDPTEVPVEEPVITPMSFPVEVPESTEVPGAEPMLTPVLTPEPTQEPTATVVPTVTPVPTNTPEPIVTREPTSTPVPTATPEPIVTPEPTSTPVPTITVAPTPTLKPTATPEPTATPTPVAVKGISVGDTIVFGNYEQDNNLGNGKEPIEWYVLDIEDGNAFLLSKYVLDRQQFDSNFDSKAYFEAFETGGYDYYITWDKSTVRTWLNDTFYNSAFTGTEKDDILLSELENLPNGLRGTDSGPDTTDRVFLLSESEAEKYFGKRYVTVCDESRDIWRYMVFPEQTIQLGEPTEYAKNLGVKMGVSGNDWSKSYCSWKLRTTGGFTSNNVTVGADGFINQDGGFANGYGGIRPCIRIDLTTASVEKSE